MHPSNTNWGQAIPPELWIDILNGAISLPACNGFRHANQPLLTSGDMGALWDQDRPEFHSRYLNALKNDIVLAQVCHTWRSIVWPLLARSVYVFNPQTYLFLAKKSSLTSYTRHTQELHITRSPIVEERASFPLFETFDLLSILPDLRILAISDPAIGGHLNPDHMARIISIYPRSLRELHVDNIDLPYQIQKVFSRELAQLEVINFFACHFPNDPLRKVDNYRSFLSTTSDELPSWGLESEQHVPIAGSGYDRLRYVNIQKNDQEWAEDFDPVPFFVNAEVVLLDFIKDRNKHVILQSFPKVRVLVVSCWDVENARANVQAILSCHLLQQLVIRVAF